MGRSGVVWLIELQLELESGMGSKGCVVCSREYRDSISVIDPNDDHMEN